MLRGKLARCPVSCAIMFKTFWLPLLLLLLLLIPVVECDEDTSVLSAMLGEFMKDSEMQLILDLDIFQSLLAHSPSKIETRARSGDFPYFGHILRFLEPLKRYDVSPACLVDISHFVITAYKYAATSQVNQCSAKNCTCTMDEQLKSMEWIFSVLDAMGKVPSGVLNGNVLWTGSWSVCRRISVKKNHQGQLWRGQYCLAGLQAYNKDNPLKAAVASKGNATDPPPAAVCHTDRVVSSPDPNDMKCFDQIPLLNYGICAPDTCTAHDVEEVVRFLAGMVELAANRSIVCAVEVACHSANSTLVDDTKAMAMLTFIIGVASFMFFGTVYDYTVYSEIMSAHPESDKAGLYKRQAWFVKTLLAFSVYTNGKSILRTGQLPGQISCLHGLRVLSMAWIILGHTYYYLGTSLTIDNLIPTLIDFPLQFINQVIVQAPLAVDSFFYLSGMLTAFLWFRITAKLNGQNVTSPGFWAQFYLHRYIRLTPVYVVVMGIDVLLSIHASDGPFWRPIEKTHCNQTWWVNLLYMNNWLLQDKEVCMGWTWYLANDFQFYCLAPSLLILLYKYDIVGVVKAFLLIALSSVVKLSIVLSKNYPPAPILTKKLDIVHVLDVYWTDVYIKPYIRCGPYITGVLVGYTLYKFGLNVKLNKWLVAFGWTLSTIAGLASVFGLFNYARTGELSQAGLIIYTLLGRNAYAFSLAWVTYACATGYGGPVNAILSWRAFMPLSRITFCAYLIHPILIQVYNFSRPTSFHFTSTYQMMGIFATTFTVSYFCGFFLSMAFEIPVGILEILIIESITGGPTTKSERQRRRATNEFLNNGDRRLGMVDQRPSGDGGKEEPLLLGEQK